MNCDLQYSCRALRFPPFGLGSPTRWLSGTVQISRKLSLLFGVLACATMFALCAPIASSEQEVLDSVVAEIPEGGTVRSVRFAPDGSKVACVYVRAGREYLLINGILEQAHDYVGPPVFSACNGHQFAYVVQDDQKFRVMEGANSSSTFNSVSLPLFDPSGRLAFHGVIDGQHVIVHGSRTTLIDGPCTEVALSDDGERLVYSVCKDGRWRMAGDGVEPILFDEVSMAAFCPDARHFAYTAKEGDKYWLVVDNSRICSHCDIRYPHWSSANSRFECYFRDEKSWASTDSSFESKDVKDVAEIRGLSTSADYSASACVGRLGSDVGDVWRVISCKGISSGHNEILEVAWNRNGTRLGYVANDDPGGVSVVVDDKEVFRARIVAVLSIDESGSYAFGYVDDHSFRWRRVISR